MNKNNKNNCSDILILIYSKYSAASVGFEEKIEKYITQKVCIDNQWSRSRILSGGITKVPSLIFINSMGARTILQGIDECNQVLENLNCDEPQVDPDIVSSIQDDSNDSSHTTKIKFDSSENITSISESNITESNDFMTKNSTSSVMEKAQQMQQSRES